jgi:hypothetical protein
VGATYRVTPTTSIVRFGYRARLVNVPAPGTVDALGNPPRIKPRGVLDRAIGTDDLFRTGRRLRWTVRLTVLNATNTQAMYNFLSTCAGSHVVPTRSARAEMGIAF